MGGAARRPGGGNNFPRTPLFPSRSFAASTGRGEREESAPKEGRMGRAGKKQARNVRPCAALSLPSFNAPGPPGASGIGPTVMNGCGSLAALREMTGVQVMRRCVRDGGAGRGGDGRKAGRMAGVREDSPLVRLPGRCLRVLSLPAGLPLPTALPDGRR